MSAGAIVGFNIDWYDNVSNITQSLFLKYFLDDNTIEIVGEKSAFLKRIYYPDVKFSDLFLGNTITIHNRLYTIKSYANKFTNEFMRDHEIHFVAVLPSTELGKIGELITLAKKKGLVVAKLLTTQLESFVDSTSAKDGAFINIQPTDTVVEFVGLTLDIAAKNNASFNEFLASAQRISSNITVANKSVELIQAAFARCRGLVTTIPCTLCLVKPHVFKSAKLGDLLTYIAQNNYQINGLYSIHLTIPMTEEFFEAYRGVINDYSQMVEGVAAGPVLAITLSSKNSGARDDIVNDFREFCGPNHPELARILRPKSLRAVFGDTLLNNAVHCTDLPDDGEMECRYFFDTLANL